MRTRRPDSCSRLVESLERGDPVIKIGPQMKLLMPLQHWQKYKPTANSGIVHFA